MVTNNRSYRFQPHAINDVSDDDAAFYILPISLGKSLKIRSTL
ncbi:hypothetical protein ENHYD8BJ_80379 [Enhydrobacter sp. 8BJ]|nr:hypothetical protein ENHY17A_110004 [Moraxellaceae bacterium 17A]VXB68672.1 hypothetical protein ENHYD8BJ_80379 [Enhydrobacter sp. 8BJ]